MYDTLLFLHVLAAFILVASTVMFSGFTLGAPPSPGGFKLASGLENVGAVGTLVFGVWLALYVDGYSLVDGWIIAAIVIWLAAGATGSFYQQAMRPAIESAGSAVAEAAQRAATLNWIRAVLVVALLADMIWKPGA